MKTKKQPQILTNITHSMSVRRRSPMTFICALTVIVTFLAMSGQASNILVNPGFETTVFTPSGWQQHSLESWSSGPASSVNGTQPGGAPINIKLVHSGNDGLWAQGTYGNGGTSMPDEYVSQTFACFPGNAYTADAWYSAYLFCSNHIGGDDGQLNACYGAVPPYSATQGGGSTLFTGTGPVAQEDGWVEVKFLDPANVLLADYKSKIITPAYLGAATISTCYSSNGLAYSGTLPVVTNAIGNVYLAWADLAVTNQYDVSKIAIGDDPDNDTAAITNTLGAGQSMVAPPGSAKVEFSIHLYQAGNTTGGGAPFWDDATLNQVAGPSPSVITPTPNGQSFFTGATNFSFNVTSASTGGAPLPTNSTSNIGIVVNGVNQTGSLQFNGQSTNLNATLQGLLASNSVYTIKVSVTNSVGLVSAQTVTFDTFPTNPFVVSAEDYDYTNGVFIQNPIPTAAPAANSYFGTGGNEGVDLSTYGGGPPPSTELIRNDGRACMQIAADMQLPLYLAQSNANVVNVQIAYNNVGNWFNYTRNYPTGNNLVFLRANNQTAGNIESLNVLTSGYGTATQTTNNLGVFIGPNNGAAYSWVPLTDAFGNVVIVNLPAGQHTLQLLSGDGSAQSPNGIANFVDFIIVPAGTVFPPFISNLVPNNLNPPINANIFLTGISNITFTVGSHSSTVAQNKIQTLINGVDVSSQVSYTGNNTSWNATLACPQNQLITLTINATDATGASNSLTETFDTFTQNNLMIEGVDWDFNAGQFIDNPLPTAPLAPAANSYYNGGIYGTNASVYQIDYTGTYDGEALGGYRNNDNGFQCEVCSDFVRDKFVNNGSTDYDLGYYNGGEWANYTRTFPANAYNVFGRMAGGAGPFSGTTLKLVTSGRGTTNQPTQLLGSFADANAAGWQTWHWVPMRDASGNLATVSLGGVQTLKLTSGNNLNVNFVMFAPSLSVPLTASISGANIQLQFPTQAGHNYTVVYKSTLTGGTWLTLTTVPGDGTVKTVNDPVGAGPRFYRLQIQ
jgi:hypothetical protein